MENLTQRIRDELRAPGTPDEIAERISRVLAPDYDRAEKGMRYAIRVAMDKERLAYWMGRLLSDEKVSLEAAEALLSMGYPRAAMARLIELGEPRASLL